MRLLSVCVMLIPLLTVEGTGVITPAWGRVIQTGEAVTLAGLSDQEGLVPPPKKASQTPFVHRPFKRNNKPPGSFWRNRAPDRIYISTLLWFNIDAIHSNVYIQYTQTDWAVSSYTNTSEGIWLLTATERLWSVASINDISASATQKKRQKKKGWQTNIGSKVRAHWGQTNKW